MPQPPATKPLGLPFIELQSIDSTNNYARQQIHAGLAQHGTAFFAHEQTAGKGQRGKSWATEKGSNLVFSIVLNPSPLQLGQQFQVSACVALAVHDLFAAYAGDETKIKWPNDLYWQDRKAGGILIENMVRGESSGKSGRQWTSIIGVGININQSSFDPELKNPVSLKQITGKEFDPVSLAKELCVCLDKRYRALMEQGFQPIYQDYLSRLYKWKQTVRLRKANRTFDGLIKGVSPTGKLIVQHSFSEEFDFGSIEWVL